MHVCEIENGTVRVGDTLVAKVCSCRRAAIRRNHSSVHLMQAALRKVLGNHVEQAGSYVDADRVRFDFKHFAPMTCEELTAVEAEVNSYILKGSKVDTIETDPETAKGYGAIWHSV